MPIMCLVVAIGEHMFLSSDIPELSVPVMKAMQLYSDIHTLRDTGKSVPFATEINWPLIYIVLSLTTTLICTLLIVYGVSLETKWEHHIFLAQLTLIRSNCQ